MNNESSKSSLLQEDRQAFIKQRLGDETWITIYAHEKSTTDDVLYWCALIPNHLVDQVLNNASWEFTLGDGYPACATDGTGNNIEYLRFGDSEGIEPLVFRRYFHGLRNEYVEISEEFRHFHGLWHDRNNNKYVKIYDDGHEEDVIKLTTDIVQINRKHLREFLAIKEMHLAIYFDMLRFSPSTLNNLSLRQTSTYIQDENFCYSFDLADDSMIDHDKASFSKITGKKLVKGLSKAQSDFWPYKEKNEEYPAFIIGTDKDGRPITHSCNPAKLADLYGKNRNAPSYLTEVFFSKQVLTKYYSETQKFSVEDNLLRCGGLWSFPIDNNHADYVVAYLGDLGQYLPESERGYWKSYNVVPDGHMSDVSRRRSLSAEFVEPERHDLLFKSKYVSVNKKWEGRFGWPLFLPLEARDEHYFTALHTPLSDNQKEFDEQVLALVKVLIDSLNEAELSAKITSVLDPSKPPPKGITKLELFLQVHGLTEYEQHIKFLRNLQELRSKGTGHRKNSDYAKIAHIFQIGEKDLGEVFDGIFHSGVDLLDFLEATP